MYAHSGGAITKAIEARRGAVRRMVMEEWIR